MEFNFSIVILFCFLILITTNTIIEVNAVPADRLTNNEGASFDRATEIELLAKSNNGWSKSEEKFGTFQKGGVPSSFVKEEFVENNKKEEKGEEKNIKNGQRQQQNGNLEQNPLKVLEIVICLYYFEAQQPNQLSFSKSEVLEILAHPINDPDWWYARNKCGQKGFVPTNYFEIVERNPPRSTFENLNLLSHCSGVYVGNTNGNPNTDVTYYRQSGHGNTTEEELEQLWSQDYYTLTEIQIGSGLKLNLTEKESKEFRAHEASVINFMKLHNAFLDDQQRIINNNSSIRRSRNVLALQYGSNAESHEIQWFAQIFNTTALGHNYRCGGAAIHRRFIVTSAHCFKSTNADDIIVKIGSKKLFEGGHIQILKIIRHKIEDIAFCLLTPQLNLKILLIYRKEENVNSKSETSTVLVSLLLLMIKNNSFNNAKNTRQSSWFKNC